MDYIRLAEEKLASYIGVRNALLTSAGRTALVLALKSLGIGLGDSVIMPSFSCDVVSKSIEFCEAKPIFADVDPLTFNISPEEIEKNITRKTKAILIIHCYGQPADVVQVLDIASKHGIPVIEDAAHALGAEYQKKKVGRFGSVSVFSFSKNMNCMSGGALMTDSDDLLLKAKEIFQSLSVKESAMDKVNYSVQRMVVSFGRKRRHLLSSLKLLEMATKSADNVTGDIPRVFSADDRMAIEVIEGLRDIDEKNHERRRKAKVLTGFINGLDIDLVTPPFEKEDRTHVYYIYGLKVSERGSILKKLRKIGRYTCWSLPWQCQHGFRARELSRQLVLFELNSEPSERDLNSIISTLPFTSKSNNT